MAPHPQKLTVTRRAWPLAQELVTAHGVQTKVDVVVAEISDGDSRGRGECVPLAGDGESIESVIAALEAMKSAVFSGLNRETLQDAMPPGAARNARLATPHPPALDFHAASWRGLRRGRLEQVVVRK